MQKRGSEREDGDKAQINVFIRARPLRSESSKKPLKFLDKGVALNYKEKIYQFHFDGIFDETVNQQKVFDIACLPIVKDVLAGNNAALFVYGQTGTGKTYTMGTLQTIKREDQGLIPLALNHIISTLSTDKNQEDWSISLSFMQIYMQDIYDLLNPTNNKLQIREDLEYGETYVEDLVIVPISNYQQSIDLVNAGLKYRKIGNQRMNQLSSRSHTIFTVYVSQKISPTEYMSSTLSLIDLAGSERIKKSNSAEKRLEQAKFINTSLSALGNVISALSENNSDKFVPYRSSKLTRILKNSLTGRSKISVICTLDISEQNTYETYSSLLFADRCKEIRFPNQPTINIETFEELEQEKDLRAALDRSMQKEREYIEIIRNLEQGGSRISQNSQRESDLSQIIQIIYKFFGELNGHLKNKLQSGAKGSATSPKMQIPKVTSSSTPASIKLNITKMAEETMKHINTLTAMAFGENKNSAPSSEVDTLTSLLLDSLRQSIKLYETILIKDDKDSLEKEICLEKYEKERRQEILQKLKVRKHKSLQNSFEEIWAETHSSFNPLQSLLNNIRRGDVGLYAEKSSTKSISEQDKNILEQDYSNPKEFLKMLTRQQSERKKQEMLIDQGASEDNELEKSHEGSASISGSTIKYFQKTSPTGSAKDKKEASRAEQKKEYRMDSTNQIKKLLDSLIANKASFEEHKKERLG